VKQSQRRPEARHLSRTQFEIRTARAALGLVALSVPVAVFWTGGVGQTAVAALWAIAALAAVAALPHRSYQEIPNPLAWLWFALTVWAALALLPLPRGLVALLHPAAVSISDASRAALGLEPLALLPIAIAPAEAAFQVALYGAGAALALTGGLLMAMSDGRRTAVHGMRALLWLPPIAGAIWILAWSPWLRGLLPSQLPPLLRYLVPVNPNQVAALLTAGLGIALGSRAISSAERERSRWTYVAVAYAALIVLIPSRGGIVGALFVFALAGAREPKIRKQMRRSELTAARQRRMRGLLKSLVVLSALFTLGLPVLEREFGHTVSLLQSDEGFERDGKVRGFALVLPHALDGWALGQGAGSLPVRILEEHADVSLRYEFAENIVLDRLIMQGLLFSIVFWLAMAWIIALPALRWKAISVHQPVYVAMVGLLVHELVDFSLEMACGLLPLLAMGTIMDRLRPASWIPGRPEGAWLPGPKSTRAATAVALVVAGLALWQSWDRRELDLKTSLADLDAAALAERVAASHTGSHHAFYRLGRARLKEGDRAGAERAFARAVALKPASHHARLFLAESRIGLGKPAADLMAPLLGVSIEMRQRVVGLALGRPWGEAQLVEALLLEERYAEAVATELAATRPDLVDRIVRALRKARPNDRFAVEATLAGIYVRQGDYDQARIVAAALLGDPRTELAGLELLARVAMFAGNHRRAFLLYRDVCDRDGERLNACELAMREVLLGAGREEAIDYIRSQYPRLHLSAAGSRLYWTALAEAYLKARKPDDAVNAARRALGYGGDNVKARTLAVRAMLQVGNWRGAQSEIERMRQDEVDSKVVADLAGEVSRTRGSLR
jgi:predicted Zn-dependent protease